MVFGKWLKWSLKCQTQENDIYFIQVDGKNDGFFGSFTLYLKEWPLSTENNLKATDLIKVYPNPSNGKFIVDLSNLQNTDNNLNIEILSIDGSVINSYQGKLNQNEYEISIDQSGLFIVRVTTLTNNYSIPIVVK